MKIKTSELTGAALDWAVAKCEGWERLRHNPHKFNQALIMSDDRGDSQFLSDLNYSTNWTQGGPIIERERIQFRSEQNIQYRAFMSQFGKDTVGESHLIAAMRCYVASKLGDKIEVPDELVRN